jgi:hypothetical protein
MAHLLNSILQVKGPRSLRVKEQHKGKIQYPQTSIEASCFRLLQGRKYLRTYQAVISNDDHPPLSSSMSTSSLSAKKRVTHSFCSHCATPICLAQSPQSESPQIILNVNCLDSPWVKLDALEEGSEATKAATTTTLASHTKSGARKHSAAPPSHSTPLKKDSRASRKIPLPPLDTELLDEKRTRSDSVSSLKGHLLTSSSTGTSATLSTVATGGTDYMSTVTMGLFSYANQPTSSSVSSSTEWPESVSTPPRSYANNKKRIDSPSSSSLSAFAVPSSSSLTDSSSVSVTGNSTSEQSYTPNEFSTRDQLRRYMAKHLSSPTSPGGSRK